MKIHVDRTICTGHALCAMKAPQLYVLDDEGYCAADGHDVPPQWQEDARRGALACPEKAITLTDETSNENESAA